MKFSSKNGSKLKNELLNSKLEFSILGEVFTRTSEARGWQKNNFIHHHPKLGGGGEDLLGNFFEVEKNFQIFWGKNQFFRWKTVFLTVIWEVSKQTFPFANTQNGGGHCLEIFLGGGGGNFFSPPSWFTYENDYWIIPLRNPLIKVVTDFFLRNYL